LELTGSGRSEEELTFASWLDRSVSVGRREAFAVFSTSSPTYGLGVSNVAVVPDAASGLRRMEPWKSACTFNTGCLL
jgi:hypothetical protein